MHVVACLDLSPLTEDVVVAATTLASRLGARLTLLHVGAPEPDFIGYDVGPDTVRDAVANSLRREHRELESWRQRASSDGVETHALMVQGPTVDKLLTQAERLGADYLVLGSHGHSALFDLIAGSVTQGVLKQATVPVLVVPAQSS